MKCIRTWLMNPWICRGALVASGVLTGLCVAFPVLGVLEWISLVPALVVWLAHASDDTVRLRRLYVDGLWFNYSFSLVIFHFFFYMYPLEFTGLYPLPALFVVLLAWLGLSLLQTLFGALLPLVLAVLLRGRLLRRVPTLGIVTLAALFCVREWCQTLTWTGVPWGRLALGQTDMVLMLGTARWLGSYAITFVLVAFNACVAYATLHVERRRLCALSAAGLLAFQLVCGAIVLGTDDARATDEVVTVAAIQGNIGSADKWYISATDSFYAYYALSADAAEQGADIILWPEIAVPTDAEQSGSVIPQAIEHLLLEYGDAVLLAGYYIEDAEGNEYNAIRAYDTDGSMIEPYYTKRHPVPFGEYVPMRALVDFVFPALTQISQLSGDVASGDDSAVFTTSYGRLGSLICFDSIYEQTARDSVRDGAQLLCVSTNDSWFFDSAAANMHLAQAKLRAVETGRYVARSATTGISAVIAPTGKTVAQLGALEEGVLYGEAELRSDATLYVRVGNVLVFACLFACACPLAASAISALSVRRKARKSEE